MKCQLGAWPASCLVLIALITDGTMITAQESRLEENEAVNLPRVHERIADTTDEDAIRAIPLRMIDAWNRASGEGFAAPFTETADFIAFEGTHLEGRRAIAEFHQQIFATDAKGTRLEGEVKFVRFLTPELAVMHAVARVVLPGQEETSPSRDSMQLFVAGKHEGEWRVEGVLNARKLTLERQFFLDDLDALPAAAQRRVAELMTSLAQRHRAERGR